MTTRRPRVALDGHYSMAETASILDVDRKTIYRWRQLGYLRTRHYRHNKLPFVLGREIVRLYDIFN